MRQFHTPAPSPSYTRRSISRSSSPTWSNAVHRPGRVLRPEMDRLAELLVGEAEVTRQYGQVDRAVERGQLTDAVTAQQVSGDSAEGLLKFVKSRPLEHLVSSAWPPTRWSGREDAAHLHRDATEDQRAHQLLLESPCQRDRHYGGLGGPPRDGSCWRPHPLPLQQCWLSVMLVGRWLFRLTAQLANWLAPEAAAVPWRLAGPVGRCRDPWAVYVALTCVGKTRSACCGSPRPGVATSEAKNMPERPSIARAYTKSWGTEPATRQPSARVRREWLGAPALPAIIT